MDILKNILIYFLSVGSLSALAIGVLRIFISRFFDAGIETYKLKLSKEIELYKNDLAKVSLEHQIRFTKLHEERAEKIKVLHSKIIELESALFEFTRFVHVDESILKSDLQKNNALIFDLKRLVEENSIYFSDQTVKQFEMLLRESNTIVSEMGKSWMLTTRGEYKNKRGRDGTKEIDESQRFWEQALNGIEKNFREIKIQLRSDFRDLLGIIP